MGADSSRLLVMSAEYLLHLAGDDGNGIAGDDQLLIGRHDDHPDLTIRGSQHRPIRLDMW